MYSAFLPQLRKKNDVTNARAVGEEHYQPVYTNTFAGSRGQAIFQSPDIIGVVVHCLGIACFLGPGLFQETCGLILRVVQFGKAIGDFAPGNVEFESVCYCGIASLRRARGETSAG